MISVLFIFFLLIVLFAYLNRPDKPPILGIYTQKNKFFYLKFIFFYTLLSIRKGIRNSKRKSIKKGFYVSKEDVNIDKVQPLSFHEKAVDAVYFNTLSKDGDVVICSLARRPNGVCNGLLYLRIAGHNLLLSPKLPDTTLQQTTEEIGTYNVEGISMNVVDSMKIWSVKYNGKMKDSKDRSKTYNVELNSQWKANFRHFNYDYDLSPLAMARSVAMEPWSREYFVILEDAHQTHYEQYGCLEGIVKIDDMEYKIKTHGVRDHSFGKFREWKNFHRYGLHFISLENGDSLSVGVVCKPVCFSSLTIGFICIESEKKVYPIDSCTLELFRHGENLDPPLDYAFQFKAAGKTYTIQINVTDSPTFFIGSEHECRVDERFVTCKVNDVSGWGAAEWYYRNIDRNAISQF